MKHQQLKELQILDEEIALIDKLIQSLKKEEKKQ